MDSKICLGEMGERSEAEVQNQNIMIQKDWGCWGGGTPQISVKSFSFEIKSGAIEFSKSKISPNFKVIC